MYICTVCIIQCCGIWSPGFLNTCIHNTYNIIVYVSLTGTSIGVRSVSYLNCEFLLAFSVVLQANSDSSLVFKYLHFSRLEVDLERCTCTEILCLCVNYHDFDNDHPTYIGTYILYVGTGMYYVTIVPTFYFSSCTHIHSCGDHDNCASMYMRMYCTSVYASISLKALMHCQIHTLAHMYIYLLVLVSR